MSDLTDAPQANTDTLTTSPPEKLSGFEWWRRSLQYRTGMGISEDEKKQFEQV